MEEELLNSLYLRDDIDDDKEEKLSSSKEDKLVLTMKEDQEQKRLFRIWNDIKNCPNTKSTPFPDTKFVVKVRNRHLTDANAVYDCNAW